MTERAVSSVRSSTPRGRTAFGVVWLALALFLALLALLALRVGEGKDPALRARAAVASPPPPRVLVRRIYERKVIVHLPPSAPPQAMRASQQVSASGSYGSSLPVTRTS